MTLTRVTSQMQNEQALSASGTGAAVVVSATNDFLQSGGWFKVKMTNNSENNMTLNGKPVKILDIYATEESQWTITDFENATKDQPKVNVYRSVYQNVLSSDVEYRFRYLSDLDIYEVFVDKIYKHAFIPCGNGKEITELQDAFGFVSQFNKSMAMDPEFMNVEASTEYYPNKAQISIVIPAGTSGSPVTSVMTKKVRVGENNLNGVEVINEGRYSGNTDPDTCIIDFQVTLGTDDLACINVWKTDLGEIHGITIKFDGVFSVSNQSVVRYNRSEARFKNCIIDVRNATFSGTPAGCSALYADRPIESFGCTIKAMTGVNYLIAVNVTSSAIGSITVTGNPYVFARAAGVVSFENVNITGTPTYLLNNREEAFVSFIGSSTTINGTNIIQPITNPIPISVYVTGFATITNAAADWQALSQKVSVYVEDKDVFASGQYSINNNWVNDAITGTFYPFTDDSYDLGFALKRVQDIYLVNSPVVTSDEKEKQNIRDISVSEQAVATALKGQIKAFKFKNAVTKKGDDARTHFGLIAQTVRDAFIAEGLDPTDYGVFCSDTWTDENGIEQTRLGIRYDELFAFIISTL